MERAPGRPSAQTSTLKPSGTLSLSTGSCFADFPVTSVANGCKVACSSASLRRSTGSRQHFRWAAAETKAREHKGRGASRRIPPYDGSGAILGFGGLHVERDPGREHQRLDRESRGHRLPQAQAEPHFPAGIERHGPTVGDQIQDPGAGDYKSQPHRPRAVAPYAKKTRARTAAPTPRSPTARATTC